MASCALWMWIGFPLSHTSPAFFFPQTPKRLITSSVRPAPIRPAMPRISPLRTSNEMLSQTRAPVTGSSTVQFFTSSTASPRGRTLLGLEHALLGHGLLGVGDDRLPVAQDGDPVGDPVDLPQAVGDVDAGHSLRPERVEDVEQVLGFGLGQRGRWLVEDE